MVKNKKRLFSLVLTSTLTAITVVLSRFFSVNIWNMSIGFSFVSIMLCGMLLGPLWCGICGGLADLIGALLFPFGPYFPGFTATAFLSGVIFGILGKIAAKEQKRATFIALAIFLLGIKESVCSLILNSLWISLLYGSPFTAVALSRIPLSVITLVLEVAFAIILKEFLIPKVKKEL